MYLGLSRSLCSLAMTKYERDYIMNDLKIKEISRFVENNIEKTRLIISENGKDTEIILEGNGELKMAVNV